MEQRSLRKKDSSFSFSSEKSGKERKPKAARIIVLLHQFNFGIYTLLCSLLVFLGLIMYKRAGRKKLLSCGGRTPLTGGKESLFLVALTCQIAVPSNQRQLMLAILIARTAISVI